MPTLLLRPVTGLRPRYVSAVAGPVRGVGAVTFADMTATGTAVETATAAGSGTFADVTSSATALEIANASAVVTFADVTSSSAGVAPAVGSASVTLEDMASAATATVLVTASVAAAFDDMTATGASVETATAAGAVTFEDMVETFVEPPPPTVYRGPFTLRNDESLVWAAGQQLYVFRRTVRGLAVERSGILWVRDRSNGGLWHIVRLSAGEVYRNTGIIDIDYSRTTARFYAVLVVRGVNSS